MEDCGARICRHKLIFSLFSLWLCAQTPTLARLVVQIRARLIHSHMALALPLLSVWLKLYALPIL